MQEKGSTLASPLALRTDRVFLLVGKLLENSEKCNPTVPFLNLSYQWVFILILTFDTICARRLQESWGDSKTQRQAELLLSLQMWAAPFQQSWAERFGGKGHSGWDFTVALFSRERPWLVRPCRRQSRRRITEYVCVLLLDTQWCALYY